jgi:hypothetical protein
MLYSLHEPGSIPGRLATRKPIICTRTLALTHSKPVIPPSERSFIPELWANGDPRSIILQQNPSSQHSQDYRCNMALVVRALIRSSTIRFWHSVENLTANKGIRFMRIAQIAPLTEAVPPSLYGGTERVISWLTEELVTLGQDVTLFASGDSVTVAKLEPMWPRALRLDGTVRDPNALHMMMVEQICLRANEFDLMHFHLDYFPFSLMSRQSTPFITTLHGRLDLPEHQPVFATFSSIPIVSISNAQRRPIPKANWVATVHHGLPAEVLQPQPVRPSRASSASNCTAGEQHRIKAAPKVGLTPFSFGRST